MRIHEKPRNIDAFILSCFALIITFQPFFMNGEINAHETGLYLPTIDAILRGLVPYRDFFYLRGAFELYMPAFLMNIFGTHIGVLYAYFYIGTLLTLIACVLIGRELYKTRYIFYLMVLVLVGRTWPRVVFTYWGGMRYAFGLFALLFAVRFFKREKIIWMFWAGLFTALGLCTSIEIGVCAALGIIVGLICSAVFCVFERKVILKAAGAFALGALVVVLPYAIYLLSTGSLSEYIESVYAVVANMQVVINPHMVSEYPSNFGEAVSAMVNPLSKNFRHMTPSYFYLVLIGYLFWRIKNKKINNIDLCLICIGAYGMIMYNAAFRAIWASQFEMALQPEKILLFFILERIYFFLREKKGSIAAFPRKNIQHHAKLYGIYFLFLALFMSSVNYAIMRYNRRFFAFKYVKYRLLGRSIDSIKPLADQKTKTLQIERARGVVVPAQQADELEALQAFIDRETKKEEVVFMFPDLGVYNFLVDRPFLGRFPTATFSWFNDDWHRELIQDLKTVKPRYIVMAKKMPDSWSKVYLSSMKNDQKYNEILSIINARYALVDETPLSYIYQLKKH